MYPFQVKKRKERKKENDNPSSLVDVLYTLGIKSNHTCMYRTCYRSIRIFTSDASGYLSYYAVVFTYVGKSIEPKYLSESKSSCVIFLNETFFDYSFFY